MDVYLRNLCCMITSPKWYDVREGGQEEPRWDRRVGTCEEEARCMDKLATLRSRCRNAPVEVRSDKYKKGELRCTLASSDNAVILNKNCAVDVDGGANCKRILLNDGHRCSVLDVPNELQCKLCKSYVNGWCYILTACNCYLPGISILLSSFIVGYGRGHPCSTLRRLCSCLKTTDNVTAAA